MSHLLVNGVAPGYEMKASHAASLSLEENCFLVINIDSDML